MEWDRRSFAVLFLVLASLFNNIFNKGLNHSEMSQRNPDIEQKSLLNP